MSQLYLLICIASFVLLIWASIEQQSRGWQRCLTCSRWFDMQGKTTMNPPLIARFALHRNGVCPKCAGQFEEMVNAGDNHSFSARNRGLVESSRGEWKCSYAHPWFYNLHNFIHPSYMSASVSTRLTSSPQS
jgi:hypothetical protein